MRILIGLSVVAVALSGCEFKTVMKEANSSGAILAPAPTATVGPIQIASKLGLSAVSGAVSVNLASQQTLSLQIQAAGDFAAGQVNLSVDRGDLAAADPTGDLSVSVSPASIMLSPGETKSFNLVLDAKSSSRSFSGAKIHLLAQAASGAVGGSASGDVMVGVLPLIEIRFNGGASPEAFLPAGDVGLRAHTGGVTVRFINYDTARAHIVHSSGPIPHENTAKPMLAATAVAPGGTYEVKVLPAAGKVSSTWWCHSHESSAQGKKTSFNTDL